MLIYCCWLCAKQFSPGIHLCMHIFFLPVFSLSAVMHVVLFMSLFRNQFVMEYCGEVMNYKDFQERAERYDRENRRHYYFMTLRADEVNCKTLLNSFEHKNCSSLY